MIDAPPTLHVAARRTSAVAIGGRAGGRILLGCAFLTLIALLMPLGHVARSQDRAGRLMLPGNAVVTSFAGARLMGEPSDEQHPLDRTLIDPDGVTLRILRLASLGGPARGDLAEPPSTGRFTARQIGHVFGLALSQPRPGEAPDIYAAATSFFGLPIVVIGADGQPKRAIAGAPGTRFMPGLFGPGDGGPGSIWRIDGRTGAVTLHHTITTAGRTNGGPGLGGLGYHMPSRSLFVPDLETGLIHRIAEDGKLLGIYDHGGVGRRAAGLVAVPDDPARRGDITSPAFRSDDPQTWGYAPAERLVTTVAVHQGRLLYAVAEGPAIWSVGLGSDGAPLTDARLEIDVKGTPAGHWITGLAADDTGALTIAQRGAPTGSYAFTVLARAGEAVVLSYPWLEAERRWSTAALERGVGLSPTGRSGTGGIAYGFGYGPDGIIYARPCRRSLLATGEHLRAGLGEASLSGGAGPDQREQIGRRLSGPRVVHGVHVAPVVPSGHAGGASQQSWLIDLDGRFDDVDAAGHVGNIAVYAPCVNDPPEITEREERQRRQAEEEARTKEARLDVETRCRPAPFGGDTVCTLEVRNEGVAVPREDVVLAGSMRVLYGPRAGGAIDATAAVPDGGDWRCETSATGQPTCRLPASALKPGTRRTFDLVVKSAALMAEGNLGMIGCATLAHPNGRRHICAETGIELVVRKTGPAQCQADAICRYALEISNNSPLAFSGPVILADRVTIRGQTARLDLIGGSGPTCESGAPGETPFACRALLSLAPGETRSLSLAVRLPGPGGYWAEACFGALDPALLANPDLIKRINVVGGSGGAHPSCVMTFVPRPPEPPRNPETLVPPLIPLPLCPGGRPMPASGRCPCPLDAPWSNLKMQCEPIRPACHDLERARPDGACCPYGQVWLKERQSCGVDHVCPDRTRRMPDGRCCRFGLVWNVKALSCVSPPPVCPDVTRRAPDGSCCPERWRWSTFLGRCAPPHIAPVPPLLPVPQRCHDSARRMPSGACCPDGQVWSPLLRRCVRPPCPQGQVRDSRGNCVTRPGQPCPRGQTRNTSGDCVRSEPPPCPQGQTRNKRGDCVGLEPPPCPRGQARNKRGDCVRTELPPCPTGQRRNRQGECVSAGRPNDALPVPRLINPGYVPGVRPPRPYDPGRGTRLR